MNQSSSEHDKEKRRGIHRMMRAAVATFFALAILSSASMANGGTLAYAAQPYAKKCESLYYEYKQLGSYKFQQKYSNMPNLDECLKAYGDQAWTFNGKDKIDQQSAKLSDAQQILQSKNPGDFKSSAKITSKTKVIRDRYIIKYDICTGHAMLDVPAVAVKSELDSYVIISKKSIPADVCKSFETWIDSKNADKIEINLVQSASKITAFSKVRYA